MARVNGQAARQASGDLFPTDQPIPASQMIGRAADVREVAVTLENGGNLVVAGPRRTGKTSVCDAAVVHARAAGFYVVSVDLFRLADAAEFAEAVVTSALSNRAAVHQVVRKARRFGRQALSAAQGAVAVKLSTELGDAVEFALTPGLASENPQRALATALELPERVAKADDKRCVVFIDEFQEIANERHPYGDPDALTKQMRAIFQRSAQCSYVFAGSIEHIMRDLFAPTDRAFSGFGSFYRLRTITPEEWAQGLRERFRADQCTIDDDALDRLIELGELHPRVTMLIAQKAHFLSILLDTREITRDLVTQAYDSAYHGDVAMLDQMVERIRSVHKHGLRIARRVGTGQTLTGGMHAGDANRALKKLLETGMIERVGHGDYRILNPLLRRHLAELQQF
jgi:hypothetical protein